MLENESKLNFHLKSARLGLFFKEVYTEFQVSTSSTTRITQRILILVTSVTVRSTRADRCSSVLIMVLKLLFKVLVLPDKSLLSIDMYPPGVALFIPPLILRFNAHGPIYYTTLWKNQGKGQSSKNEQYWKDRMQTWLLQIALSAMSSRPSGAVVLRDFSLCGHRPRLIFSGWHVFERILRAY